jgi:SAM-dependent methyltransferase
MTAPSDRAGLLSGEQPREYYDFQSYVSPQRMLTYWHQIKEVVATRPANVLEVGLGTGLVASYLRASGVAVTTIDINPALRPDIVGSVLDLKSVVPVAAYDAILCARVLHHIPFEQLSEALDNLAAATRRHLICTLPIEDFSVSIALRYTSGSQRTMRIPLPLMVKRAFFWNRSRSGLWKINDSREHHIRTVTRQIGTYFKIDKAFRIPEDAAHQVFVCTVK